MEVYAFLGSLASATVGSAPSPEDPAAMTAQESLEPAIEWTTDELRRFATTATTMNVTIGKVMDVLAAHPGKFLSTTELESATGVPRANLKGSMSALTRHITAHYPGHNWMFVYRWGPQLGGQYPAEAHYTIDETSAERWLEVRR